VIFEGEEGIDEGGPAKEFMQIVIRELLDPQFAMFKMNEESRLLYFNPHTFELGLEFELIGIYTYIHVHTCKSKKEKTIQNMKLYLHSPIHRLSY